MKSLFFLLFIAFVSSQIKKGLIQRNVCIGGKIENGKCLCPNKTALIGFECKPCINGSIILGKCKCPQGKSLIGNKCKILTCPPDYIKRGSSCIRRRRVPIFPGNIHLDKPVIYLYPEENMDISVQLNIKNSQFTTIYPKFNEKNTWNVKAKPNGDILINGRTYPYLFWEADSYNHQETNEGFIVSKDNAEQFLEEKLQILGLNEKEKTDFITFWLPKLLSNKLSLCTFQTKKFFENIELNVTPKPDSMIRVFLTIKKLDAPINIKEQKLVSVERKGFTVIEWGGSNL
jgi:hypothetical protein